MNAPVEAPRVDEAERGLVAACIVNPALLDDLEWQPAKADFCDAWLGDLWSTIQSMRISGTPIDGAALAANVRKLDGDSELNGRLMVFVAEVIQSPNYLATTHHAAYYAARIRERSLKQRLIRGSHRVLALAVDPGVTASESIAAAERELTALRDDGHEDRLIDSRALMDFALAELQERRRGLPPGMKFGFWSIDRHASLRGGQLWIVAARPRVGKSAFALNVAGYHAETKPVLFATMEMLRGELVDRLLANYADIDHQAVRDGQIFEEQWDRVVDASARLSGWNLFIDDTASQTVTHISSKARRLKRKFGGKGLIIIDYLQIMEPETPRGTSRNDQLADITRRLKKLAMELDWPVMCLSQMNRLGESDSEHRRPSLSMLRDSGAIEQDADNVMFLHRSDVYRKECDRDGKAVAYILKQRGGPQADCELRWTGEHVRFSDPPLAEEFNPYD